MEEFTATPIGKAPSLEEQIRQIVREEIAAHMERLKSARIEVICLSKEKEEILRDYLKLNPTI